METIHTDLQQISYEQIDLRRQEYELEKKELLAELDQLTISFENLEKDNISLREQLNVYCENGTGFTSMIQKWDEEKAELKKRISEQEYLKDVLEEKATDRFSSATNRTKDQKSSFGGTTIQGAGNKNLWMQMRSSR